MPIIYRAISKTSGKSYIGYSASINERIAQHHYNARSGREGKFYDAIRKHGEDDFSWEVLYEGVDAFSLENEFISHFDSVAKGYNMTDGGRGVPGATRKTIWINDGTSHKRVQQLQLQEWIDRGWKEGRIGLVRSIKMTKESKERIGRKNKKHGTLARLNQLKIPCQHCGRSMNPGTLARHLPVCTGRSDT